MFRRRIYAQGFTILAMVAGSAYWEGDRQKRSQYNELLEDKKKKEKHESWLKELEARDEEEQELRRIRDKLIQGRVAEKKQFNEEERRAIEDNIKRNDGQNPGGLGTVKSVLEETEGRRQPLLEAVREAWDRRK